MCMVILPELKIRCTEKYDFIKKSLGDCLQLLLRRQDFSLCF